MRRHSYPSVCVLNDGDAWRSQSRSTIYGVICSHSGCAIARKIFGGHGGDKGFHEMWSAVGNSERGILNSFAESPQELREMFIPRRAVLFARSCEDRYSHHRCAQNVILRLRINCLLLNWISQMFKRIESYRIVSESYSTRICFTGARVAF